MELFCFLILHYQSLEDTENCIASIKRLDSQDQIRILIVDNHSPNGSGTVLYEKYKEDPQAVVIITEQNYGFSKGNNIGCKKAVDKWAPDYLVVTNNDIVFPQRDFLKRIHREYAAKRFDILGPDIFDPNTEKHQSPMDLRPPSASAVLKTVVFNSAALLMPDPFISSLDKTAGSSDIRSALNPHIDHENVVLQGSCLIYSGKYLKKKLSKCHNCLFYPETRFYYEEYIQTLWCGRNSCEAVYSPSLLVHHMGGRATSSIPGTDPDKIRFRMRNIRDSAVIYLRFLLKANHN